MKLKRDYIEGIGDTLDLVPIGAWHGNGRKAGALCLARGTTLVSDCVSLTSCLACVFALLVPRDVVRVQDGGHRFWSARGMLASGAFRQCAV